MSSVEYRDLHRRRHAPTSTSRPATSTSVRRIPAGRQPRPPPDEFGERYLEDISSSFTYLGLPTLRPAVRGQAGPSGALDGDRPRGDRHGDLQRHADAGHLGGRPMIDGARADACTYCRLDVEAADRLLDEADFDRSDPDRTLVQLRRRPGCLDRGRGQPAAAEPGRRLRAEGRLAIPEYMPLAFGQGFTGPFRSGWTMDYPSPQNYLEPLVLDDAHCRRAGRTPRSTPTRSSTGSSPTGNQARSNARLRSRSTTRPRTSCSRTCRSCRCSSRSSRRCSPSTSRTWRSTLFGRVDAAQVTVVD